QQGPIASIVDGIGQGLGYTIAISILAAIRELFGNGTLLDNRIIPEDYTIGFLIQPASSFIILGIMFAVAAAISNKKKNNK
ncbi:MAG: Rnf-Nqr domain containing protein, partial [Agathobacter rectalis]|nr:Rnf-Nqr domain containing protein [Agathobacter rectalis]